MMDRVTAWLRRDGWLLGALLATVALCLMLGASEGTGRNREETRLCRVLSAMEGAGSVDVAVYYDGDAVPCGAVVVADGAGDAAVRIRLADAVTTLLGLDAGRVAVYEREGGR